MHNDRQRPDHEECRTCPLTSAYHELDLLFEIATQLSSTSAVKETVEKVMRLLKNHSYLERCALFVRRGQEKVLDLFASIDLSPQQQKMANYRFGEGATGLAAKSAEPVVIENIHNNIDYLNKLGTINSSAVSFVAVPLLIDGDVVGVITANMTPKTQLSFDGIVRMLTIAGSLCTRAFHVKQVYEQEKESLTELTTYYQDEILKNHKFESIIGKSTKMQQIFGIINTVAPTDATVLIRGETGTGKELIAAAIHNLSKRKNGPFIKLNCAAISETLLESELFGHEKGAFTDAKETRKGRFELADGGTLFLDEIGDITPSLQVKLLRILQEQEFERVGGTKTVKVDVRIVTATNRPLEKMVQDGTFREDLFYRLNVIPINLPPLRERYDDVRLLIEHYLKKFMKEHNKDMALSKAAMENLLDYPWPGNIRELQNMMERIVLICPNGIVEPEMLNHVLPFNYQRLSSVTKTQESQQPLYVEPTIVSAPIVPTTSASQSKSIQSPQEGSVQPQGSLTKTSLKEMEKEAIIQALIDSHGIQTKAARILGMTARQIGYKIKQYGIEL